MNKRRSFAVEQQNNGVWSRVNCCSFFLARLPVCLCLVLIHALFCQPEEKGIRKAKAGAAPRTISMAIAQLTWSVPITDPASLWWRNWTSSSLALRLCRLRWPHCIYQPTAATSSLWRSTRCRERSAWPTGISGQVLRTFTDQLVRILQSVSSSCPTPSEVLHHWRTQDVLRAKRDREDSISPTVHSAIPSSPNPRAAGGLCMATLGHQQCSWSHHWTVSKHTDSACLWRQVLLSWV